MADDSGTSTLPTTLRQRAYRKRMGEKGITSCLLWVPVGAVADLRLVAENLRANPKLSVRLYNTETGRMVKLKQRPPLWPA